MGAGLILPLLSTLGLSACFPLALVTLLGATVLITVFSISRMGRIVLWGGLAAALVLWLTLLGGLALLTETVKSVILEYSGYLTSTLYATEITLLLSLVCALLAWALTREDMGLLPAVLALLLVSIAIWATDSEAWALTLTPGAAAILLIAAGNHENEAPLRRVLPLALVLALLSGLVTLTGGLTVEPLHRAANELRERIEDYLFFTAPRNVFSLAAEGYYPQGQNQLGGTAEPSDRLVMVVETPVKTYLRGSVKNEYTGRAWYDTTGGRRYLWISPRWSSERTAAFDMALPSDIIRNGSSLLTERRINVQMADSSASSLFVPQRVRSLSTGTDAVPYFNRGSEIFTTRDLRPGDVYTVTAPLMTAGEAGIDALISACASSADPQYASVAAVYTRLPEHMQSIVFELAHEITQNAQTPYEKAFAIQNFLMRSFRYTLEVEPQPENIDFVTNFLFNAQEGYCTYFASAMTVLCRMAGLPARYVEGYLAEPGANGIAYVTGRNGHAWTEVYFSGFGWLTFDATPLTVSEASAQQELPPAEKLEDTEDPTPTPESPDTTPPPDDQQTPPPGGSSDAETPTPLPPDDSSNEPTPTPAADESNSPDDPAVNRKSAGIPSWLWWLLLVLLLLAACVLRIMMTAPERLATRAKSGEDVYGVWVQAVYDALCSAGLPAVPSESPIAYTRRLDGMGTLPVRMSPIGKQISMVYYGKVIPEKTELQPLYDAWHALLAQHKPATRIRLILMRAFVPLKRRSFLAR